MKQAVVGSKAVLLVQFEQYGTVFQKENHKTPPRPAAFIKRITEATLEQPPTPP